MSYDELKQRRNTLIKQKADLEQELAYIDSRLTAIRQEQLREYFAEHHNLELETRYNITDVYRAYYKEYNIGWSLESDTYVTIRTFVDEDYLTFEYETGGATIMSINEFTELFIND